MDGITTRREEVLNTARRLVMGDRNRTYGPPTEDFARTARILTAMGLRMVGADGKVRDLAAHDHALILLAVKLSRLCNDPQHQDSWVDVAGYAACGWECVPPTESKTPVDTAQAVDPEFPMDLGKLGTWSPGKMLDVGLSRIKNKDGSVPLEGPE